MQGQSGINQLKKWNRRNLLIFIILLAVLIFAEFSFHFIEMGIGRYLVWQNEGREQTGRSWADAKNITAAGSRLENYSQKIREQEQKLNEIRSFNQLLQHLESSHQLTLPANHYLRIYNSLPLKLNSILIPPDSLIFYRSEGMLDNVFVEMNNNGFRNVFLNQDNAILTEHTLDGNALDMLAKHGTSQILDISNEERFQDRIFRLERFQRLLDEISFETKNSFLSAMPALVELAGPTTRVAISNEIINNFHEVGIANDNLRAVVYYIPADWINELIEVFDEQDFDQGYDEEFLL